MNDGYINYSDYIRWEKVIFILHVNAWLLLQTMDVHTFTETVSCFLRVTWAAAAGRLHLIGTSQVMIDSSSGHGRRSRQSSTGKENNLSLQISNSEL